MAIFEAETIVQVPFYDLDPMNIVWHGNYLKYIEIARCDLLDKLGYNYTDMRQDGVAYPLAKMDIKFIKPATFDQKLKIFTKIEEVEPALIMKYLIVDANSGEKVFSAKSMQVCVNAVTKESIYQMPKRFLERIERL